MFSHSIKKKLIPYIDGELNRAERSQVEKHLAVCPSCRRELELLRGLTSALRCAAPAVEAEPVDLWPKVQPQITKVPRQSVSWLSGSRLQMAGVFAVVILIVIVGFGMLGKVAQVGKYASSDHIAALRAPAMPPGMGPGGMPGMGPGAPGMPRPGGMPPGSMGSPGAMGGPPMPGGPGMPPAGMRMPVEPRVRQQAHSRLSPSLDQPVASMKRVRAAKMLPRQQEMAKAGSPTRPTAPWSYGGDAKLMAGGRVAPPAAVMAEKPVMSDSVGATRGAPLAMPGASGVPGATPQTKSTAPSLDDRWTNTSTGGPRAAATPPAADLRADCKDEEKASPKKRDKSIEPAPLGESYKPGVKETPNPNPQVEDLSPSRWRVMAQEARKAGKTSELAEKFESSFKRTNRADIGLFLLDIRMNPPDKAGLVRTADGLNRLGSTSQDFWLRVGVAYEIAGKFNAARIAYERALQGPDAKAAASAKTKANRLRPGK